jgi:hypothetical protein
MCLHVPLRGESSSGPEGYQQPQCITQQLPMGYSDTLVRGFQVVLERDPAARRLLDAVEVRPVLLEPVLLAQTLHS